MITMSQEELQDSYGIMNAVMFDYANKEELSFWDRQVIKGLETTLAVFKAYSKQNSIKLLEPGELAEE